MVRTSAKQRRPLSVSCPQKMQRRKRYAIGMCFVVISEKTSALPKKFWNSSRSMVRSVVMTNGIIGCPHQEGIDYHGEWCPVCEFWRERDRFTGQMLH